MIAQHIVGILILVSSVVSFVFGFILGLDKGDERKYEKRHKKMKLIEGIDGVTSVQLTPIRYVELLTKEEELNELKLKVKRVVDENI